MCDKCKGKFYITTPIYYPSDKLHIGHTYCTVATDAMARYKRLQGYDVCFLTGTDEHGQKIETRAKETGVTPKEFVDHIVEGEKGVKDLWKLMNISYDRFIRTTDSYHVSAIQKIFKEMYEKGDIYKGTYEGMYCTPCESFWTASQLKDGKCPDCGREVQPAQEEAYFFRLSKYAGAVRDLLVNTDFLEPRSRVNEMVNNFIDPGLEDLFLTLVNIAMLFADGESYYLFSALLPYWLVGFGYYQEVTALIVAGGALLVLYLVCFLLWNKHPAVSVAALVMFVVDCGFMAWLLLGEPIADNLMEILLHVLVLAYLIYGVYIAFALRKKQKEVAELERANQGPEL